MDQKTLDRGVSLLGRYTPMFPMCLSSADTPRAGQCIQEIVLRQHLHRWTPSVENGFLNKEQRIEPIV